MVIYHLRYIFRYSISKIYYNNNTIYYYCSDTHCGAKLKVVYDNDLNSKEIKEYNIIKFTITKEHTLNPEEHTYIFNKEIMEDLKYKSLIYIKRKMSNYNYLINIIKKECIINDFKGITGNELYEFINKKYGKITINANNIEHKFITNEIKKYKKKNNILDNENIDINHIINLKTICGKIASFYCYYTKKNKNLHEQLLTLCLKKREQYIYLYLFILRVQVK